MKDGLHNKIQLFKKIETICLLNPTIWNHIPEFRGAFSSFAFKVAQLDMLLEGSNKEAGNSDRLLSDIERILHQRFDRFFDYLKSKYAHIYHDYKILRS